MDSQSITNMNNMNLMYAINEQNDTNIKQLLDNGADPNFFNTGATNGNCTPLHIAVALGDHEAVRILLRKGAKHDTANANGISPWNLAQSKPEIKAILEQHLQEQNMQEMDNSENTQPICLVYDRRPGTSGIAGQLYESKLLALVLNRLQKGGYEFLLGSNIDGIGEFDDLCLRYRRANDENYKYIFLQAKHRDDPEKKRITVESLHERNPKKNYDYSIYKHFENYLKIRERFGSNESIDIFFAEKFEKSDIQLVLYTTAKSDCLSEYQIECEALLKTSVIGKVQTIVSDIKTVEKLCKNIKQPILEQIGKNEGVSINECFKQKLANDFFEKFKIYFDQGKENEVGEIIEKELDSTSENNQLMFLTYHNLVQKYWMSIGKVEFLTESCDFFRQAKQQSADKLLENLTTIFSCRTNTYGLEYNDLALEQLQLDEYCEKPEKIFLNIYSKTATLSLAKISQYFMQRFSKYLAIIDFDQVYQQTEKIIKEFVELDMFRYMIIYCSDQKDKLNTHLCSIDTQGKNKKIILISNEPISQILGLESRHDTRNSLAYLTSDCREKIIHNKFIIFQNRKITLNKFLISINNAYITGEIFLKILKGEGCEIAQISAEPLKYYINRRYELPKHIFWDHSEYGYEHRIKDVNSFNGRIVIIAADPGMGKSSILTHLARNDDVLWIVRFNFLDFTEHLKKLNNYSLNLEEAIIFLLHTANLTFFSIEIMNSFIFMKYNQQSTHDDLKMLEAKVFEDCYNFGKMIVFADGFDEIAPHYIETARKILKALDSSNIQKLLITTRDTHAKEYLESQFPDSTCYLKPFSIQDAHTFCVQYWKSNMNIKKLDMSRAERFASDLIDQCTKSISTDADKFICVPLHIEMIARYVQDTFLKYHETGSSAFLGDISTQLNLISLYSAFIRIKFEEIYLKGKNKTEPTTPVNINLKERFQKLHERLSLYVLFNEEELDILLPQHSLMRSNDLKKIKESMDGSGFVTRIVDNKPQFIHLTFAEFFAASVIWEKIKQTSTLEFELLVKNVLIETLIKHDAVQICRFIYEFALQDSNSVIDKSIKGILIVQNFNYSSLNKSSSLLFMLVELCVDTNSPQLLQFLNNSTPRVLWRLIKSSAALGYFNILQKINDGSQILMKHELAKGEWDKTPLWLATEKNHCKIIAVLVNKFGYDVTWLDRNHQRLLPILLQNKKYTFLTTLIDSGITEIVNTHADGLLPVYHALCENATQNVIETLLRATRPELLELKHFPNKSWYLLRYDQTLTLAFLKKGVDLVQTFLFENLPLHDKIRLCEPDYFVKMLSSIWMEQMEVLAKYGVGFHVGIYKQLIKINFIIEALLAANSYDDIDLARIWLKAFITNKNNTVHITTEEVNMKLKTLLYINGKYIDVTKWIDIATQPEIIFSYNIDYISSLLDLKEIPETNEQLCNAVNCILKYQGTELLFGYLSSDHHNSKEQLRNSVQMLSKLLPILENLQGTYKILVNAIPISVSKVSEALQSIPNKTDRQTVINCRDEQFGSPLLYALAFCENESVKLLLDEGANPNIRMEYLNFSGFEKLEPIFSKVLNYGNVTPLHIAAFLGNISLVELLHSKGANLEATTPYTPLHLAAREGHVDVVGYLIDHGARIDAEINGYDCDEYPFPVRILERGRTTPLTLAEKYGHQNVVELLKSFESTVENGFTELHKASASNDMDTIRILIQSGDVDINASTKYNGYTPLHVGAENGHAAIVLLLLRNRADKNAKSFKGKTPREVALAKGFEKVTNIIESFQLAENANKCEFKEYDSELASSSRLNSEAKRIKLE